MSPDDVMAFVTNECLQVHAMCDRQMVPRRAPDGSMFSMAQRVAIMEGVLQGFIARVGSDAPRTTEH